ncbi:efflux RND transporter periplasmic adaptor subunit [Pseudooceanicola sp. GBMRC 2024]|uniref:Efflux RND transporter periplasmic adaptor subunit n=1 Tax=Pseudooceanicola albus TaxID=2692189 RepID=A0A6L7G0R4_9RHOB|nr:HlyD family secretion protein [Pseudooceanicola albus]MXN17924.1 efflux RND transporter periplasmic adaptor subunit [Pseudooceanicola albus]
MIPLLRRNGGRVALTLAMLACAGLLGAHMWRYYMEAPWTRDGRVSADVVRIAPQVGGTVDKVAVQDNQFVHKGDLLFEVDPENFRLTVEAAQASLDSAAETMRLKASTAARDSRLQGVGAISDATIEQTRREAAAARADYRNAQAALAMAQLSLRRTSVRAPVDGYVTNLHLHPGDYAAIGTTEISLVDAGSFHVTGYFRETQLARIHPGDPVHLKLMGSAQRLTGHVDSIGRGIADSNADAGTLGLPEVEPVFDWVRLAQRIPVRIRLDTPPPGVTLAAGLSASAYVDAAPTAMAEAASRSAG